MSARTTLILLALCLGTPIISARQEAQPQAVVAPAEATALQALQQDSDIVAGTLPNGLRYLIRPTTEPAGRGSVRLYVGTGSLDEVEHEKGISHLIEHLVFNGSRNFKRGELIPAMQKLGLGFGGDANAYTSLQETVYMLNLPNLGEETVNFALTIMRDFADGATLTDEAIDHERGIVVSELKARDSASYRAAKEGLRLLLPGTKVADYLPIGTEEVIRYAPYSVFRDYYARHYVPGNMCLVLTGDFDPATARSWVEKHFSDMEAKPMPERPGIGALEDTVAATRIIPNAENAHTSISLNVVRPAGREEDTLEKRMADLPLDMACAMLNARLERMAREEGSSFLSAESGTESLFDAARVFSLTLAAEPAKWNAAMGTTLTELRRAIQYGFGPRELQEIAAQAEAALEQRTEAWSTTTCDAMADTIINAMREHSMLTAPAEDLRAFRLGLQRILANPELCREALRQAFDAGRVRLALMGTVPEGVDEAALRAHFEALMQEEVSRPQEEKLKPFAYEQIGTPGTIVAIQQHEAPKLTTLTLSNGVRVNFKQVDFRKGSVNITVGIDGGLLRLTQQPGLESMAVSVMQRGGLEAHSASELKRLMAGHRVSTGFWVDADRFFFSGHTTAEDLELQCKLLAANILHPGYRSDGERMLRRSLPSQYNRFRTTPNGAYALQAGRILYGDDTRFATPSQEQVEACHTEMVREALSPYLQKGAMEVSIVGDFDAEKLLPILERTFGAMPERQKEFTPLTEAEKATPALPQGTRHFLHYDTELDKTLVTHVYAAGDGTDTRRNRRLQVLASIVREKLFDGIRAQLGETYSPSVRLSVNEPYTGAATITATSAGVKGNRIKVNTAIDLILSGLGRGEISEDDFACAIRPFIARTEKSLRSADFWSGALTRLQSEPRRMESLRNMVEDVRSITLEEIRELAKEIFGTDKKPVYLFTVPAEKATPQAAAADYAILISRSTMQDASWVAVAEALKKNI
ncbi:MAG: insulinase family protein [Akkermansia sp.]|nr:insulinase family protein [Akkermansia sp.]